MHLFNLNMKVLQVYKGIVIWFFFYFDYWKFIYIIIFVE